MAHMLVDQLRFTRSELVRCLDGISDDDARRRIGPMNCISWMVGHLANQEQSYWLRLAQGKIIQPELNALVGTGQPATTPPLDEMWSVWREITLAADDYLETLTAATLSATFQRDGQPVRENTGTMLLRNIHHYWFHIGEACAIRQQLGHQNLPEFVGSMANAGYHVDE